MPTPRLVITLQPENSDTIKENLREIAIECGFQGRYGGNVSGFIVAIASLPAKKRRLLTDFLKTLLTAD